MKRTMLLMLFPLLLLTAMLWAKPQQSNSLVGDNSPATLAETPVAPETVASAPPENLSPASEEKAGDISKKKLVSYAMSLLGTPYVWAGTSPEGFDCSGFISHVFKKFEVNVPHSSALQAKEGVHIAREEAKAGDIVIFTGTNPKKRTPGHVGIIISTDDDNIEFVHSSSVGGVKVSKVEGTGYSRRFLQIRRLL